MTPAFAPFEIADDAVVRSAWDDALERDGELLVLCGTDVTLLSPLACEAAIVARHGITVGELAERLRAAFGDPAGGTLAGAVRELVATLLACGVMTVDTEESGE